MKLYQRLHIEQFVDAAFHLRMAKSAESESPKTEYETAWNKLNRSDLRGLLALDYFLMEDQQNAILNARACLEAGEEFLFGRWRNDFKTPKGKVDPRWWKEAFIWMDVYRHCLVWGAALSEWKFLKRASEFPEETACLSMGTKPQDRDGLVAIAAILRGDSQERCIRHINRLAAGPKKGGKLLAAALEALMTTDPERLKRELIAFLQHYKRAEFPKSELTKKISVEGTVIVRWAQHLNMNVEIPSEFEPHIVILK